MFEVKEIYKAYGEEAVLKGVDLAIGKGTIQCLIGKNGAGKSTLVTVAAMLKNADAGKVVFEDKLLTREMYEYRNRIGYVFDKPIYVEGYSAEKYLMFVSKYYNIGQKDAEKRTGELLEFFDLPRGGKKKIMDYSTGMKAKVSLAAALLHRPKFLILDEPFGGLDFLSIEKIQDEFKKLAAEGISFLITSHQYDAIASVADKLALLADGRIKFNLSMEELKNMAMKEGYGVEREAEKKFLAQAMR